MYAMHSCPLLHKCEQLFVKATYEFSGLKIFLNQMYSNGL